MVDGGSESAVGDQMRDQVLLHVDDADREDQAGHGPSKSRTCSSIPSRFGGVGWNVSIGMRCIRATSVMRRDSSRDG